MRLVPGTAIATTVTATVREPVDVIVAGGGTAGVVAAIAAARTGARTLLIERRNMLGGMMTGGNAGLTTYTVYDKRQGSFREIVAQLATDPAAVQIVGGIPREITQRLIAAGDAVGTSGTGGAYVFTAQEAFKRLLLQMLEEAGARLLLHALVVDVMRDGDALSAVVVETKSGRQVYPATTFVDATGDGDLAARAGVPYTVGVAAEDHCALSGTSAPGSMGAMGVMFRMANVDMEALFAYLRAHPEAFQVQRVALQSLEEAAANHARGEMACFVIRGERFSHQVYNSPIPGVVTLCCPCYAGSGLDVDALTAGEIALMHEVHERAQWLRQTTPGFANAFLLDMPEIGVRETRHIEGEYKLRIEDLLARTAFPDSIGRGSHPIDIGPLPEALRNVATVDNWSFEIPYRALLAKGVANLLLAGRCISATHEAFGCTRTTVQCMITGQAAGTAAALAACAGVSPKALDVSALRARLAADGVVL